jgi:hypothetical protein
MWGMGLPSNALELSKISFVKSIDPQAARNLLPAWWQVS